MALSPADQALIADMKQRELHAKSRQRAADAILHEARRFRTLLVALAGIVGAAVGASIFLAMNSTLPDRPGSERWMWAIVVLGGILGVQLGQAFLRTRWGRTTLAEQKGKLYRKYASELHAGRRWLHFYYQDEDISAYVPQILYFIEAEQRFDSVQAALAFAKAHPVPTTPFLASAHKRFNRAAEETNLIVVSSADDAGTPASRIMRFVKSDRPGVWYVTTAPEGQRVLERGRIAVITSPKDSGATISSNRVKVRRAQVTFPEVADLYRAQVPGYVDELTEDDQQRELVYELTLQSAKIDTWLEHDVVEFGQPELPPS